MAVNNFRQEKEARKSFANAGYSLPEGIICENRLFFTSSFFDLFPSLSGIYIKLPFTRFSKMTFSLAN